jgi:hypothetical protein
MNGQSSRDCGASGGQQGGRRSCGEKQQWVQARGRGEREVHGRHMHCCCCYIHRHASIAVGRPFVPCSSLSLSSLLARSNQDRIPYFPRGQIGILGFGALVSAALRRRLGDVFLPLQIGILGFEEAQFRLALCCMVKTIYYCFTVMMW